MRVIATIVLFFWATLSLNAQQVNIIPQPVKIKTETGFLTIKQPLGFIINDFPDKGDMGINFFKNYLKEKYKITKFVDGDTHSYGLPTEIFIDYESGYSPNEGYKIVIGKKDITITGDDKGLFYAFQTLIQLLPPTITKEVKLPRCTITDYPRFAYRGMHLDCSRHFWTVDFVKKYIDYLALHKFNTFHWHLTDDQGWRIEIKKYPKLTSVGGWRNGTIIGRYPGTGNDGIKYGGFYTQEQIKEIVKYAADRYINVIPEIEMPGHSSAAIAAYPELSCFPDEPTIKYFPKNCKWNGDTSGKQVQQTWGVFDDVFCAGQEKTFSFLEDVMDEVLALFPSKYVHVGGDECPKDNWKLCPNCQKRIKDNGLKDEHELQSYFIQRMEKYLNSKGRTLIGWDEILEGGLAPNAVVMSWRGEKGGIDAAKQNHDVIMTPGNPVYFDHTQSENEDSVTIGGYNPIEKVYAYEPVPKELNDEQAKHVLGAQANMWTEYMKNTKKVEYMVFPRISALSEVLWSQKEDKNWDDFQKRLMVQFKRYDWWKVNYSREYFNLKTSVLPTNDFSGVLWQVRSKVLREKEFIVYIEDTLHGKKSNEWITYSEPIKVKSKYLTAYKVWTDNFTKTIRYNEITQRFHFNKATGKKITLTNPASERYPGDGAFTLVNGVINEKGFARTKEFVGFNGTNCEAIIDLGELQIVSLVVVNALNRPSSWIWRPLTAEVFGSGDGEKWYSLKMTDDFEESKNGTGKGKMMIAFKANYYRYIKVIATNWGEIPAGNPGAGNKAWLFVDEIEVDGPTAAELKGGN